MKPQTKQLFFLFALVSIAEITLISTGNEPLRLISKPLIVPTLVATYLVATSNKKPFYKDAILMGLLFSWIGDLLLHFEGYFVPGLISFLTAHIFYIFFFASTQSTNTSFFKLRPSCSLQ